MRARDSQDGGAEMKRDVEEHLLNPPHGSAAAAARDFGIAPTLLIQRLKLRPEERLRQLQQAMIEIETMRAGLTRSSERQGNLFSCSMPKSNDKIRANPGCRVCG
ncbi:MAG TPA: hypothetical protein VER76_12975 [Pyrinomonadaceae bacterium]|nr:hypothetical protein [Pyrinomonadaceae bacterium]